MNKLKFLIVTLFLIQVNHSSGQLRLPKLISNGLVLQRNEKVKFGVGLPLMSQFN